MDYNIGDRVKECECGCGEWIIYKKSYKYNKIPKYLPAHNLKNRIPWNKGLTKETDERINKLVEKSGKTMKKLFKDGILKPYSHWNGKRLSEEHRKNIGIGNKGKKMSEESRNKIRIKVKERIANGTFYYTLKNKDSSKKQAETLKLLRKEHPERFTILYGNKHHMWIDGRSYIPYPYEFMLMRKNILKRDDYTCQECGSKEKLEIHHIDHNKLNNKDENLITLCNSCHRKERGKNFLRIIYGIVAYERFLNNLVEVKGDRVNFR